MNSKKLDWKEIIFGLGVTSLPAILTLIGSSDKFVKYLSSNGYIKVANEGNWMLIFSALSVSVPTWVLYFLYEAKKKHVINVVSQRDFLISQQKDSYLSVITENFSLSKDFLELNMRVWIEEKNYIIKKIKYGKGFNSKVFHVKHLKNLSKEGNKNNLYFEVHPHIQGLVGICYNNKKTTHVEDVSKVYDKHNLTAYQAKVTSDTKFVMCIAVLNQKDQVVAIVSFDHPKGIKIPTQHKDEIYGILELFCTTIFENIPELLNKKG
ncbi:hypothetical protein [Peribacillus frigoritolerans]|uniref:hypothetical protein n=1 Tax=Peribacillus frigoritolerans TaxID=450367 RepID=UPI00227ED8CB|nr:hypothetical protein [Peribacillus frigoritolerans]MCY9138064.1 hypothetical protein [Peribacillus frigoritolerans]